MTTLFELPDVPESSLPKVIDALNGVLQRGDVPFCLWLIGPVGAGKSTTVRQLLRAWGLPEAVPVTSPTFTYLNDYLIGERSYAHMDLYRVNGGFDPEELGLVDYYKFSGLFIEWPGQLPASPLIKPTHALHIEFGSTADERTFRLEKV